jgi:hypothetical protein
MIEEGETAANSPEGNEALSNGDGKVGRDAGRVALSAGAAGA